MKRWLNEPLLHFLLAGGVLFAAYGWLNRGGEDAPRTVRITAAEVDWLRETWARQWQRPPTDQELRGLVADYLKESLLAREAEELGLGENDTVVRRRLAQKMEFLVQDTARLAEPSDEELRRLHVARGERYQEPARISFLQIFFKAAEGATAAKSALSIHDPRPPAELGDRTLLEREYHWVEEQEVSGVFGAEFATQVLALEPGQWHGPLSSGYGFHLVLVRERMPARARPFDEVRARMLEDWHREQQTRAHEQFFSVLLEKYDVVVDESVKPLLGPKADWMGRERVQRTQRN